MAINLKALEADRRLMLVGISHDLATPITRLWLALELMSIKSEVADVEGMVDDLEETDYARTGREEESVVGHLNGIVVEVCKRYQAIGNPIATALEEMPSFAFRPLAIRRLVTNLLDNAVCYGVQDLKVSTRSDGGTITLTVTDRGPGTPSRDPNELIKPFVREKEARGPHIGAGLGLSIVERIARDHSASLSLANRPDGGMIATVILRLKLKDHCRN